MSLGMRISFKIANLVSVRRSYLVKKIPGDGLRPRAVRIHACAVAHPFKKAFLPPEISKFQPELELEHPKRIR